MKLLGTNVDEINGSYYYADGPDVGKPANIYKCNSCGKLVQPIFKGVPGDVESYVYEECDECLEVLCKKCVALMADELNPDAVVCEDCYGGIAMKKAMAE